MEKVTHELDYWGGEQKVIQFNKMRSDAAKTELERAFVEPKRSESRRLAQDFQIRTVD